MVGHQHVGMDGTVTGIRNPFQDLQILKIILRLEKHQFPVMTWLSAIPCAIPPSHTWYRPG